MLTLDGIARTNCHAFTTAGHSLMAPYTSLLDFGRQAFQGPSLQHLATSVTGPVQASAMKHMPNSEMEHAMSVCL